MKKLLFNFKLALISLSIFIIQLILWIVFEYLNYNQTEFGFFLFVTAYFFTFYIAFWFFQKWLNVRKLFHLLLMASVQIGFSIFIIISNETAKIRATDIIFYLPFVVFYFIILNRFSKAREGIILLIICSTILCFFFYQKLAVYVLSGYFQDREFSNTSALHHHFYYINQDSSEIVYPFREKNKIYFIEFWNRSCGACINKLPEVEKLIEYYKSDSNIRIISLYCPASEIETRAWFYNDYLMKSKNIPNLRYCYTDMNAMKDYRITTFPHFYLIDKNGSGIEGTHINFDKSYPSSIYEKIESLKQN